MDQYHRDIQHVDKGMHPHLKSDECNIDEILNYFYNFYQVNNVNSLYWKCDLPGFGALTKELMAEAHSISILPQMTFIMLIITPRFSSEPSRTSFWYFAFKSPYLSLLKSSMMDNFNIGNEFGIQRC